MKKMTKRFLSVLLAVLTVVTIIPVSVFADGDITVSTADELRRLSEAVAGGESYEGRTVVLAADIDLGGKSAPWSPIGSSSATFKGIFDGGYHVVSGLYIDSGSSIGLFGDVNGGEIRNLVVRGEVSGSSNAAGIVGKLTAGKVTNCGNEADVSGGTNVGGVVGSVNGACTVSGCYNSGAVSGTTGYIGGVTGQHWRAGVVEDCYNAGTVSGPATVGGVVGGHKAASPEVKSCYNAGTVVDTAGNSNNIDAIVGASRGTNTDCYFISGSGSSTKSGVTEVSSLTAAELGDAFKADTDGLNGGLPVLTWQERKPDLIIGSYEAFKAFADSVNDGNSYEGKLVRLACNVFLGGKSAPWSPIGSSSASFKGVFDGGYHVVSGLYISSGSGIGLFGDVNGGEIRNLVVRGEVSGSANAAGIVGKLTAGKVTNCGNEADVSGGSCVGGVVGYVNGDCTVGGCYNRGAVSGTTGYIGGVTGQHWRAGVVEDCYNAGTVSGPATVGGVVGGHKAASPVLTRCLGAGAVVDTAGNSNNIDAVIGASRGKNTDCYYLGGVGTSSKSGITEVSAVTAAMLGSAFTDGESGVCLAWESGISTEAPSRPAFIESTELSAQLAGYIREAAASTKQHAGISGSLLGNEGYKSGASSTGTDWMALAMGRFGYFYGGEYIYMINDGMGYADYLEAMRSYIDRTYAANGGILHSAKATEWHRAVVTIGALRGDPTSFGSYNGAPIDLIADGSYNCMLKAGPGTQGINGWIWGLIAMDTGMYDVPEDAKYTRETFIKEILKMQLTDGVNGNAYGGWVLGGYGSSSDVDISAMAIQALAPYYNDDTVYTYVNENSGETLSKTVRACVDEALDRLGMMQNSNGGFSSWNTDNVESISQVVVALCSLGISPAQDQRFITSSGKTLLDGMLRFRVSDGGFCHVMNGGWNSMATDQATYALVSYWRLENGMRALYDMRGERSTETQTAIKAAEAAITAAVDPTSPDYRVQLKSALAAFRAVPVSERRYVGNYSTLAASVELVGGESALDGNEPYAVSISVEKAPDKVRYYEGDAFDPTGMKVTATYSDGSVRELTDYKLSAPAKLELTTDTVCITYGILRTFVTIEVRERMPWAGEGTEEDPYLIKTADDLIDLRYYTYNKNMNTSGVYFKVTQDINMKNTGDWHGIADNVTGGFRGHFDGANHSIWNIGGSTYNACGLFGRLGDGAVIENLTIASGSLGSNMVYSIGAIAGEVCSNASVTVRNCHNYASMSGLWGVGGIIGELENGAYAKLERCSNHGTITAQYVGGGIIGQVGPNRWHDNGAHVDIDSCYNVGSVGGSASWGIGGIIGAIRLSGEGADSSVTNAYNAGQIKLGTASGAILGSVCEAKITFNNVHFLETEGLGAYGSFDDDGSDTVGTVIGSAAADSETVMKGEDYPAAVGENYIYDNATANSGYPMLSGEQVLGNEAPLRAGVEISNAEELIAFAARVNAGEAFTGKTVLLTSHIDMSGYDNWTPIARTVSRQFDGYFDGQGYVIDNLSSASGGLFGYAGTNATIANVGIGSGEIGSQTLSFIGAIVGWSDGADIINCWNGADITCSGWSGGIVGTVRDGGESIIRGCYNIGNVTARDGAVGGIVGHLAAGGHGTEVSVTVSDCYNLGNVTAKDNAAGIAGRIQDGNTVTRCYNAGAITVGGENILDGAGAIVSLLTSGSTVSECYYDAAQCDKGISSGSGDTAAMSRESMCSGELLALLGAGFKADSYGLVNGGYPLTYWQPTDDADEIDNVNELISAIGEVTLDSADAIIAARNAYDNLEDELKAHVSGLEQLTAAEQALAALQTLRETKDTAIKELREYKAPEDYREIERAQLELIITEGNAAIETAADADAVRAALVDAKAKLDELKTDAVLNDEESAARVSDTIASIGDVTLDSGALIESIRAAYDSLSDTAKTLVNNYNVLTAAEDKLAELRRDEDNKPKPDDKPGGDTDNKPENKPSDTKPSTDGSTSGITNGSSTNGERENVTSPATSDRSMAVISVLAFGAVLSAAFVLDRSKYKGKEQK